MAQKELEVETKSFASAVSLVGSVPPKTSRFIHGLEFVCFDGDRVYGYDDICCLETENPAPALDGVGIDVRVVQFLKTYKGKTLKLRTESDFVELGGKRTKARLPLLQRDAFLFDRSEFEGRHMARAEVQTKELVEALALCSSVAGRQPANLITCGVLLQCSGKTLSVRGISDEVIARVVLQTKCKAGAMALLPLQLADHVGVLSRQGQEVVVTLLKDKAVLSAGSVRLYTRAMHVDKKQLTEAVDSIDSLLGNQNELPSTLPKRFLLIESQLSAVFGPADTDVVIRVSDQRMSVRAEDGTATYASTLRVGGEAAEAEYIVSKHSLVAAISALSKIGLDTVGVAFEETALVLGGGPVRVALASRVD